MLTITTQSGKEIRIDMLPDIDDFLPDLMRKRTIYIDDQEVQLKSEAAVILSL
ncbi:hypothetical protein JMN32_23750 [Fulvivirga sp. 29W222]|uniref:Uncharacterized protein n=1 Tax=Fulvivirga marina TaxID=2494733 RepID=A0A937G324_9BACT|nr:hypothetical protein [Fulvivirga marina]MBL6449346.1 hypothetical protein [Fulvivirga marina]